MESLKKLVAPLAAFWQPTLTSVDPQVPNLPLETPGGISLALNQASETDLAQPITGTKVKTLGLVVESEVAQAFTARKSQGIAITQETDAAFALTATKAATLGQAAEVDQAFALTVLTPIRVVIGQAQETDFALPFTVQGGINIGPGGAERYRPDEDERWYEEREKAAKSRYGQPITPGAVPPPSSSSSQDVEPSSGVFTNSSAQAAADGNAVAGRAAIRPASNPSPNLGLETIASAPTTMPASDEDEEIAALVVALFDD